MATWHVVHPIRVQAPTHVPVSAIRHAVHTAAALLTHPHAAAVHSVPTQALQGATAHSVPTILHHAPAALLSAAVPHRVPALAAPSAAAARHHAPAQVAAVSAAAAAVQEDVDNIIT